jgi:hypothetical protein
MQPNIIARPRRSMIVRHEMHQENPERVNAYGNRHGVYDRGEEDRGRAAVKQFADA